MTDPDNNNHINITNVATGRDHNGDVECLTHFVDDRDGLFVARFFHRETISDMITTALEGGIGYWAMICHVTEPAHPIDKLEAMSWHERRRDVTVVPLYIGGSVAFHEVEDHENERVEHECTGDATCPYNKVVLDLNGVTRGLMAMALHHPDRLARAFGTNFDAEDGDVFLQMAIFGKVVYG